MAMLLLEAFGALAVLLFIVWWTMFSGRKQGELPAPPNTADAPGASHGATLPSAPQPAAPTSGRDNNPV